MINDIIFDNIINTLANLSVSEENWFFVFLNKKDILEGIEDLAQEKLFYDSYDVILCFAKKNNFSSLLNASFAMGAIIKTVNDASKNARFNMKCSDIINDERYKKIKEYLGVKEGYACFGSLSIVDGEIIKNENNNISVVF